MLRKLLIILLVIQVLAFQAVPVFAQVVTPTDTPTPSPTSAPSPTDTPTVTPTPTIDPNATPTPTPTIDPNAAVTPTPTVDPNATVTPTPTTDLTASNSGTVNNNTNSTAISGDNSVLSASTSADPNETPSADVTVTPTDTPTPTDNPSTGTGNNSPNTNPSPTPSGNGSATVTTGNAVAVSNTDNSINTNSINSQFVNQTINIFVTQNGNLDLSVPLNIISNLITQQNNVSPQINLLMNSDKSYAVVTNNIVNNANSGSNSITGGGSSSDSGQMVINTGNAYSVVSLTNKVNFTIVDSVVHVITINIFGTLNGNIILPDLAKSSICGNGNNCGLSASIVNEATVNNNVDSTAVSGQNSATVPASGSATITSGNAVSIVNLDNIVNTNVIGVPFEHLFINTFGLWNGNFLGWGGFGPQLGGKSYAFNGLFPNGTPSDCPNCANSLNIQNNATVTNNVTSSANSGNNSTDGGNSIIHTGNAYSAVQLLNFVNANFIRTFGFFGFINIFGDFNGSVGSAADFITPTPTPSPAPDVLSANTAPTSCTSLGDPSVATKVTDNIGVYINPGDTALFYVKVKNTGPNDFASEKVTIVLATNGKGVGGTILNIKKPLSAGKSELVTVGLSLSKQAPGGNYEALVTTEGITCDGKTSSAKASTDFLVSGSTLGLLTTTATPTPSPVVQKVLGVHTTTASAHKNNWPIYVLLLVVIAYLIIRGIRSRAVLMKVLKENMSLKERLSTLRMLLL